MILWNDTLVLMCINPVSTQSLTIVTERNVWIIRKRGVSDWHLRHTFSFKLKVVGLCEGWHTNCWTKKKFCLLIKWYYSCQIKMKCSPVRFLQVVIKLVARLSPGGELDSHQDFHQVVGDKFCVELNFHQAVLVQVELYFHQVVMKRRDKGWRVARGWQRGILRRPWESVESDRDPTVHLCTAQVHATVLRAGPCTSHWKWSHEGFPGLPHTPCLLLLLPTLLTPRYHSPIPPVTGFCAI